MRKILLSAALVAAGVLSAFAADVTVTMNALSTTMTLADKATGTPVSVGEPDNKVYSFTADPGTYVLTGLATDGTTVNGTIELTIAGDTAFALQTVTVYATNKVDNVTFEYGEDKDYTVVPNLIAPDGVPAVITVGNSITAGRATFLAVKNSTSNVEIRPTAKRAAERYVSYFDTTKDRKITSNATIGTALKQWFEWTLTVPAQVSVQVAQKTADYVAFTEVAYEKAETVEQTTVYTYHLTESQQYFYRAWGENLYTQGGYFAMNSSIPNIVITAEEMTAKSPTFIDHDITANTNLNVADVFVNINPQGHLKMQVGDTKDLLALRTWQLTNNSTANMYIDPDYHYTVLNLNGEEDNSVIKLERYTTSTDPWSTLTAVGKGTAIVLVTYDAIHLQQYSTAGAVQPFMGGTDWSAIWPENTGVFVVTVGDEASNIKTNMWANKGFNDETHKLAVDSLDAEHDVIYYLADQGHADYTFTPEGAAKVEIAYPTFGTNSASYKTFEEVAKAEDGSYTLQLKEGRQIVRLTNAAGVAEYQVITAKPCTREVYNLTREGQPFRAGDKVAIQYAGLYHPNNKLSRIYNMTAYVAYNGTPAGTSEYGSAGQYTFASVSGAQLYKYNIPLEAEGQVTLTDGAIQINGYGDPIGNHRNISRTEGRVFAGNAPSHKTYLGILPDVQLEIEALAHHTVVFNGLPEGAKTVVLNDAQDTLQADANGNYDVIYGAFIYSIEAENYAPLHSAFTVSISQKDTVFVTPQLTLATAAWDGTSTTEPALVDGVYQIGTPAELAWLAQTVNASTEAVNAVLTADLNLGGHNWTAIGNSSKPYLGTFDGQNHTVTGFYLAATTTYQSFFGKLKNGTIKNLTVHGYVTSTTTHAAGIVGGVEAGRLENLHFLGTVNTNKNNTAGIAGYVYGANAAVVGATVEGYIFGASATGGIAGTVNIATDTVRNCYNWAFVSGSATVGGIVGTCNANTTIQNVYNAGAIEMRSVTNAFGGVTTATTIGAICGLASYGKLENGYAALAYNNETNAANKTVVLGVDACANGQLAHATGLGQNIGTDPYPVVGGPAIYALTVVEQGDTTLSYIQETVLPDTVWINNIYGAYFNEEGQKVTLVNSDTLVNLLIDVKPLTGAATFEERTFKPQTAWYGDPEFEDDDNYWTSGDYIFSTYWDNWGSSGIYYYDITMANLTGKTFSWANPYYDQYSAAGGAAEGENYAVWYNNWYGNANIMLNEPAVVSGMAVTNNAWVIDNILNGDGMSTESDGSVGKPFGQGDWLKLTVTGYDDEEESVGSIDFYLADFRASGTGAKWKYAENWQWLDLTSLGKVSALGFSLTSSKANTYGMTTAAYFCFDNLGGKAEDCKLGAMTEKDATTTGMETVGTDVKATKLLRNGQLIIIRGTNEYNAAGLRLK